MFFLRLILFTLIFYVILNFSAIRRGSYQKSSFILPFSLALAFTLIDGFLRIAFYYSFIFFILISSLSYFILKYLTSRSRWERTGKKFGERPHGD